MPTSPSRRRFTWRAGAVGVAALCSAVPAAAASCQSLASLSIADATITVADVFPAGSFQPPTGGAVTNLPEFCRVALTLAPTADSSIRVEVWMPTAGWTGRLLGTGGGGYTGSIGYGALGNGLRAGFATANTDMGTAPATGGNGTALVGHPEKWLDFGSRSTHLMTVVAKTLVAAYYERPADRAYFSGCSTGGHQGLAEAQVYPHDYDGILAGAPGHNRTHLHTFFVHNYATPRKPLAELIPAAKLTLLNAAVRAACVGTDGGLPTDTFLSDPRRCDYDPAALQCTGADAPDCLTAGQVETARRFYDGLRNPRTGELIYPGWPRGSEISWTGRQGTTSPSFEGITAWVFGTGYDPLALDFDTSVAKVDAVLGPSVNFLDSDLSRFRRQGGKLLLYHGWADPTVSPQDTINYVERVANENGMLALGRQQFMRLFMVPGMGHCSGGNGPNVFDALTPLVNWVEQGTPPASIVATKYVNNQASQGVERTLPLCPYPYVARYTGSGDPTQVSSFECAGPPRPLPQAELPGSAYLAPLVIEASVSPRLLNLGARGTFTITLTTAPGSQTFAQWVPSSIKVEGKAPTAVSFAPDGKSLTATFSRADVAGFTGGEPAGTPVEMMVTGALQHEGSQSLFAVGATVRIVSR